MSSEARPETGLGPKNNGDMVIISVQYRKSIYYGLFLYVWRKLCSKARWEEKHHRIVI
jgi:hypothetical protein